MSEAFDYCSKCGDNCCTPVRGLKVTRPEFERVFADHEASLETVDRGAYLEVSSNAAGACPHFKDGACSIYDRRPAECRLFPYTVETIEERGDTVRAFVHGGTHCPFITSLLPSTAEARALVAGFLSEAYPKRRQDIVIEERPNRFLLKAARAMRKSGDSARRMWRRAG